MENEKKKSVIDWVWDLFASVKFAVVIFTVIALTSMVGTIVEQNVEPEKNLKVLAKMFGESAAPTLYGILDKLGFMDMYHSWWFVTFLLLFAANLVICSLDRLPRILKHVKEKIHPMSEEYIERMSIRKTVSIKGKPAGLTEQAAAAIGKIGFRPGRSETEKGVQFYAEKGNFTRLGVYITHLSILVILSGAIIGVYFGFGAFLNLPEGQTTSVAYTNRGTEVPLGFEVRCDNFEVDYYGETDMPKAYKSWLTVFKNGKEVAHKVISVNDPLTYEGITFYQSSFGSLPDAMDRGVVVLNLVSRDGKNEQVNTRVGGTFTMPGTAVTGKITNFSPALSFDESGRPFTYDQNVSNPAIYVEFSGEGGKPFAGWIFKRFPQTWNLPDGSRVEFKDFWGVQYTGLQVRRDPGVLLVYLGCIFMAIGLYITFFMSHKRLWVSLVEEKGSTKVLIGATANKNRASFEKDIEKLAGLLDEARKGGK
ncbi:MAG: cytochrome c biogenesis protein ResB [Nitrospiraceae bacterium]|nr:cytochrome c biogenesis protein ResB [Nitrospiraceae bacterium]